MSSTDLETNLKDVLLGALGEQYSSVSPQDGIITGNHYQSVKLGDERTTGFRSDRERVLDRIDFSGKKVLDLGSNLGELSRAARERGARLVDGFEYDPYFVRIANLINALNGVTRVSFSRRDIADVKTYDQRYDIVLAFAVMAYIAPCIPRIARMADVLVFETHKLDGDFEEHYIHPISEHFPVHRVLAASDWGMDTHSIRAVIVFAKDAEMLSAVLKAEPEPGEDAGTSPAADEPSADVDIRRIDAQRTNLQEAFFETFKFDTPAELVAAVDALDVDVETIARSHDARRLVYSGWVYWLLYLKGYLQYDQTGNAGEGNVFFDYLTRHYGETGDSADPGVKFFLEKPDEAVEVVRRRFADMELFRRDPSADAAERLAPIRLYLAGHDDGTTHPVYELDRPAPLVARGVDGWHRLFAARVFGAPVIRAGVQQPATDTPMRGTIDELEFGGGRLRLRGWCVSPDGPLDKIEVRARGGGEFGVALSQYRPDIAESFSNLPWAGDSGFEFNGLVGTREDRELRFEAVGLREWAPLGAVSAHFLPHMFAERPWPPSALSERLLGTSDPARMTLRAATVLKQMLEPIEQYRSPRLFTSVLDWACGVGLLQLFIHRLLPNAKVTGIDWDEEAIAWCRSAMSGTFETVPPLGSSPLPVEPAELLLGYSGLPRLDRAGQDAWLPLLSDATRKGGYVALTTRGELLRPFVTHKGVLKDLEREGISDRPEADGTIQTREHTVRRLGEWFDVLAYVEGGVGNEHDLIVLRKP